MISNNFRLNVINSVRQTAALRSGKAYERLSALVKFFYDDTMLVSRAIELAPEFAKSLPDWQRDKYLRAIKDCQVVDDMTTADRIRVEAVLTIFDAIQIFRESGDTVSLTIKGGEVSIQVVSRGQGFVADTLEDINSALGEFIDSVKKGQQDGQQ